MITSIEKQELIKRYAKGAADTGSSQVQIALLSARIKDISKHLKLFPKDTHSQRGLLCLIGQRRRFLSYLKRSDVIQFQALEASLHEQGLL